ncbi:ELKS/Rab6-interacting/CAST family member 1-like [Quillaja saponaria]|uniref:ELKS/Rab6-interacting/CAST family member 1-like n=1 Tax=Quillaja saponaria TaxID=32244 RepID=A0AAD7PQT5_QUISA|nr:ELKS/Rab6-interacting/CAST family member 1-like [Quillaja saponaria]
MEGRGSEGAATKIRRYPKRKRYMEEEFSYAISECGESVVVSTNKRLISRLIELDGSDVDSMVDLANSAFASLNWLQTDYADFYAMVKSFISYHSKLFVAKKKLASLSILSHHNNLCAELNYAALLLANIESTFGNSISQLCLINTGIMGTRQSLKRLEEEFTQSEKKIDVVKVERDKHATSYVVARPRSKR